MTDYDYLLEVGINVLITNKNNIRLKAKIVNIGEYLSLRYSPGTRNIFSLQRGELVTCYYSKLGNTYLFESIYLGFLDAGKDYIGLKMPLLQTEQKRTYARLGKCLQVIISKDQENFYTGETVNISGGGLKLFTRSLDAGTGEEMQVSMPLMDFSSSAEVVWVSDAGGGQVCLGLNFIGIQEKEREKIIKYIFNEQARLGK